MIAEYCYDDGNKQILPIVRAITFLFAFSLRSHDISSILTTKRKGKALPTSSLRLILHPTIVKHVENGTRGQRSAKSLTQYEYDSVIYYWRWLPSVDNPSAAHERNLPWRSDLILGVHGYMLVVGLFVHLFNHFLGWQGDVQTELGTTRIIDISD